MRLCSKSAYQYTPNGVSIICRSIRLRGKIPNALTVGVIPDSGEGSFRTLFSSFLHRDHERFIAMSNVPPVRNRTIAVVLLAAVAVLAGLAAVYDTLRFLNIIPQEQIGELEFMGSINWLGALLSGIVALIWFSVASQLWTLNPQGWLFVAVIAVLNLVLLVMSLLGASSFAAVAPGIALNVLALILTMLPSTKQAFGMPAR
jgi:hypothetical protein